MPNANKARGDRFEMALRDHLAASGFDVERTRAGYERDHGDLHVLCTAKTGGPALPAVIVQAKRRQDTRHIGEWLAATVVQRVQARALHGVLVIKRMRIADPGRQYAVMELDDLLALLREAGYGSAS